MTILCASIAACAACARVPAQVTVDPSDFDPGNRTASWYVSIEQSHPHQDPNGAPFPPLLTPAGFVCGDEGFRFAVHTPCDQRTELRGKVWRVDPSRCGGPLPVLGADELPEARLIARLDPVVLWPDRTPDSCGDRGLTYEVALHPPIDERATLARLAPGEDWAPAVFQLLPVDE